MPFMGSEYYTYKGPRYDLGGNLIDNNSSDEQDGSQRKMWPAADGKEYTSEEAANDASRRYHMANPDPLTPEEQALLTMPLDRLKEVVNRVASGPEALANSKLTQGAGDAFVKWAKKLGYKDTDHNAKLILHQLRTMGITNASIANFEEAFHILNSSGVLTIDNAAIQAEAAAEADRQAAAYQQQRDEFVDTDLLSLNEIAARAGRNTDPYKW